MIEAMQAIFSRLAGDATLTGMLATDPIGAPAIYMDWGERKNSPYLILTYLPTTEVADAQYSGSLQIDIFDRRETDSASYLTCLEIRKELVRLLDRFRTLDGTGNLRCFLQSEQPIPDDSGRYRRYAVEFEFRFNRTSDL